MAPTLPAGLIKGGVPPINVLIVEDNIINLRLLEAFVKRLKVRWQTAMNGREAIAKWRGGGFHLVLMDIQLPGISGLQATREIRRLERRNGVGAFSTATTTGDNITTLEPEDTDGELAEEDRLVERDQFKSPVIIVALTASSLQSDRHEALAAGCNDFLTKVCGVFFFFFFPCFFFLRCRLEEDRTLANTGGSRLRMSGLNAKSWNGVACRP
jgi:osomolarity two-component system response regulator SSK1